MATVLRTTRIEAILDSYGHTRGRMFLIEVRALSPCRLRVVQGGCEIFIETVAIGTRKRRRQLAYNRITANIPLLKLSFVGHTCRWWWRM